MDVCVLGPVEVDVDGCQLTIGTGKRRALLALLALYAGSTISTDRLVEGLWGERAPATALKSLQLYVSQLRKALAASGDRAEIVTRGHGYELRLGAGDVDARRFAQLVAEGAPREALALWRGRPLDDVVDAPFAAAEIRKLEEMRLAAVELAIEQDLAAGRHNDVIRDLDALVAEEPLRERLHAQRMLALYRSGRQADALEAYRQARAVLVDQIGIEPGAELRRLHEAILQQDPSLDSPAGPAIDRRSAAGEQLTAGTVTLLFTDLVGSTELLERIGDDRAEQLRRAHFRLLREVVAARGGQEVKSLGDGLMVVFGGAVDAVGCAAAMQRAVLRHNRAHPEAPLGVRIGLHVGDPIRDEDDYFGTPVVIARRLCDAAHDGQILTSELVRGLVGSRGEHHFRDVGPTPLKGIGGASVAWEVVWDEPSASAIPLPPALAEGGAGVFAGRDDDLVALSEHLGRARAGERRLVLVSGEPGVGKTRLAIELGRRAHAQGALVLYGRCDAEALTAHQPFVEALRHYVAAAPVEELASHIAEAGGELRSILPEIGLRLARAPQPIAGDPDGARFRLFEAVATLLAEASLTAPILLLIDDLHWADHASLLLLRHIARDTRPASLLVLGTYRETEVTAKRELEHALGDLVTEGRFVHQRLGGLDKAGVAAMMDAHAGGSVADAADKLHAQTGGNPFFVGEILRSLANRDPDEIASALRKDDVEIPAGVRQVIEQRIVVLGEEARRVLSIAAVAGPRFDLSVLEHVSGHPLDALLDTLEQATAAGVVEEQSGAIGHFAFAHALVRDTVYEGLGASRRARLHQLIAEALESASPNPPLASLAYHYSAAQADLHKAVHYSRLAAEQALDELAYEQAATNYSRALAALELQPETNPRQRAEMLVALGDARSRAGERGAAREAFQAAATLARELDDGALLGRAALGLGGEWLGAGKVNEVFSELAQDALDRISDHQPTLRVRLLARMAAELQYSPGHEHRRNELSAKALEEARRLGDPATLAAALNARHISIWVANPAERLQVASEQLAAAEHAGDRELAMAGHTWRFADLCELGDMTAAEQELEVCMREARALRQPYHQWSAIRLQAALAIFHGDLREGERLANDALQAGMRAGAENAPNHYAAQIGLVRWHQGRAGEMIGAARALADQYPHLAAWPAAHAVACARLGQHDEARRVLAPLAANNFAGIPENSAWVAALSLAAEASALLAEAGWAAALYELLRSHAHLNASFGGASAHLGATSRVLGVLAATCARYDAATEHLEDALATNARLGARPWEAWTQVQYGRMLLARRDADDRERGERLLADAHATAQQLEMRAVLELVDEARQEAQVHP